MKAIINYVDATVAFILMALIAAMVVDVTWQVFTRFVLGSPSSFTEEVANFILIWVSLLGSAYALRLKAHLGIDFLVSKFSEAKKLKWEFVIYSFVILFSVMVLIWGGLRLVDTTLHLNQVSAALRIKMGYVYMILPFTGMLLVLYSINFMLDAYHKLKVIK